MSQLPAVLSKLVTTLQTAQQNTPNVSSGDFLYLKLAKSGDWVYGADETEVDNDSAFVIDPASYSQGYVAWYEGKLIDEVMAVAGQTPVVLSDLPALPDLPPTKEHPNGVQWDTQVAFAMKGLEGAEEGLQMLYKVSSRGGKQAIAELLALIIERGKAGETALCPIILLEKSSYKHKKYGKIFTPILKVDEWIDLPDGAEPEPEPEPEPAPKRKRKTAKKVEPEPEPDPDTGRVHDPEPAPRSRRSRRNA